MTLGSHQTSTGKTQIHITPRWIIEVLGPFDLDPAAGNPRPWDCAAVNYTERDDGFAAEGLGYSRRVRSQQLDVPATQGQEPSG